MREVFPQTTSVKSNIVWDIPLNYQKLEKCFGTLVELKHKNPNYTAFAPLKLNISDNSLAQALENLSKFKNEEISQFRITEDILDIFREEGEFLIPGELIKLMIQLAEIDKGDEIYCPYDSVAKFALEIIKKGGHPYLEILGNIPLIYLLNILNEVDIQVSYSHPLNAPTQNESLEPKQHKLTICISPPGVKYNETFISQQSSRPFKSWIDRDVYALEHLLARTKNRAIILLNSTLLLSEKAQEFRESLVERKIVETVISLPSGIIPYVISQFSIVVFNKSKKNDNIRFVDGANDLFSVRENHQPKLVEWQSLYKVSRSDADEFIVIDVSKEKVLENKSSLEVAQYIYSSKEKKVQQLLSTKITTPLEKVANIVSPLSNTHIRNNSSNKIKAKEITIDQFPDYGYLSPPTKEVETINYKQNQHFLRPYDIVIVTKGSVGKVGIVSPNVPPIGEGGWVVNQSYFILRAGQEISAISLYMYLISEVGQTAISRLVSKATRPLIRLGELKELPILLPTTQESQDIEKTFNRMVKINCLTRKLAEKQQELHKKHWSI
ncbi:type I restriction enzyme (plasmid) [Geminocystis sp. NIES-3708]|uniref:N-6 DNA methylase n=1 Tax=Geminocystis sp. NIES-3708 TaxID=1615909 RepID=UPI0005FCB2B7|nr:type I restriction-modification system subunit M/S [Geminocystis sp. NIES-3708]BAQ63180.1 type I restriction enzyme [Geminocystis sp. NIES-3708]